jgi:hypothetical protein
MSRSLKGCNWGSGCGFLSTVDLIGDSGCGLMRTAVLIGDLFCYSSITCFNLASLLWDGIGINLGTSFVIVAYKGI